MGDHADEYEHATHVRRHPAWVFHDLENGGRFRFRIEAGLIKSVPRVSKRIVHPDLDFAIDVVFRIF
jgi:hypothetical protein